MTTSTARAEAQGCTPLLWAYLFAGALGVDRPGSRTTLGTASAPAYANRPSQRHAVASHRRWRNHHTPRASNAAPGTESGDGLKGRACVARASRRPARMSASILLPWCLLRQRAVHNHLILFSRPQGPSPYGTKLTSDIGQSSRAPGYAAWTSLEPTKVASGVAATMAAPGLK